MNSIDASSLAAEYRLKGYHCSESIIRSINEVFDLKMSEDVLRCACGFLVVEEDIEIAVE